MPDGEPNVYMPRVKFDASPTLWKYLNDDAFFTGIRGPLGSGKSITSCAKVMKKAAEQKHDATGFKRSRWAIIRNTYPELVSTTIKTWIEWFTEASCGPVVYRHPINHHIKLAPTDKAPGLDCEVLFMALDRPDDVRHLKSLDITGAFINEASELPEGMVDMLTGRVGRFPPVNTGGPTWRGIIADTNATDDQNWWFKYSEGDGAPVSRVKLHDGTWLDISWNFYHQPPAILEVEQSEHGYRVCEPGFKPIEVDPDMVLAGGGRTWFVNPDAENLKYLEAGYYHQQIQNKRFEWIQRFLQAKYVYFIDGKAWVPEYSDAVMSAAIPWDKDLPLVGGIDAGGGTLNPAAVVGQRGRFGDWRILYELSLFDIGIDRFSDVLAQELPEVFPGAEKPKFYIDPAGKGRDELYETAVEDHLKSKGFDVELAPTNDPDARRNALALPMGRLMTIGGRAVPGFLVHKRCAMLRAGLAGKWYLKRVQGREDRYVPRPVKNEWSHVCDAASYMLSGGGEDRNLHRDPRLAQNAWDQGGTVVVGDRMGRVPGQEWNPYET